MKPKVLLDQWSYESYKVVYKGQKTNKFKNCDKKNTNRFPKY